MNIRITITLLLLAGYNLVSAQQLQVYQQFNFSDLECGGKYITGSLSFYSTANTHSRPGFNEDNRFFLEIAAADSGEYHKLPAGLPDRGNSGQARFELPDTLVIGRRYKLRMSSTSPRYAAEEPSSFIYAPGLRPFSAEFGQQVDLEGQHVVELRVKLDAEDPIYDISHEIYPYQILLSDGSRFLRYPGKPGNDFSIPVTPAEPVTVYRISEIKTGKCGMKGTVRGEAVVTKREYINRINIRTVSDIPEFCKGAPLELKVETPASTASSRFRVEFSITTNNGDLISGGLYSLNNDEVLRVNAPAVLQNRDNFYCRVVQEGTDIASGWLYLRRVPKAMRVWSNLTYADKNHMKISFYPSSEPDSDDGDFFDMKVATVMVNGRELRQGKEIDRYDWRFPVPRQDTSFVISKVTTSCGEVPYYPDKLNFVKNESVFFNISTEKREYCEGEEAEIGYTLSDPERHRDIEFYAVINTRAYLYNEVTGEPEMNLYDVSSVSLPVKINRDLGTLSVKIPSDLYDVVTKNIKGKKYFIQNLTLSLGCTPSGTSMIRLYGNGFEADIRLRPHLGLSAAEISGLPGQVQLPVSFRGSNLEYQLSNGQSGTIRQDMNGCSNCKPVLAGESRIRVPVNDDTVIRISSVSEACGAGTFSGETVIKVIKTNPYLSLNERIIGGGVCEGKAFTVPFTSGNLVGKDVVVKTSSGAVRKLTEEEVQAGSFQMTLNSENNEYEKWFWLEAGNTLSNRVKVRLEKVPAYTTLSLGTSYTSFFDGEAEVYQVLESTSIFPYFYTYTLLHSFEVNGVHYAPDNNYGGASKLFLNSVASASLYTLNSVTNACGTFPLNLKYRIGVKSAMVKAEDVTTQNFIARSNCPGSTRVYKISYSGIAPSADDLRFEIARVPDKQGTPLKFFEIPFQKAGENIRVEVPSGLEGSHLFRVKSLVTGTYSGEQFFGIFYPGPQVKLVSVTGKSEVTGIPAAILKLESNYKDAGEFSVRINTGEVFTSRDFGIYYTHSIDPDTKELIRTAHNSGRSFTPEKTTTYKVESVFNQCEEGKATGSVKVVVAPYVQLKYSNPSLPGEAFCSGEETEVSLNYTEGFPKDTLLGLYLHNSGHLQNYRELVTFKDLKNRISFRLPDDLEQGNYLLQVRKRSRAATEPEFYKPDSASVTNLDSPMLSLTLITPPRVQLSGSTEIFSGGYADLLLIPLDKEGKKSEYSPGGVESYITLSNGQSLSLANSYVPVSPPVTEIFSVKSAKNVCGVGKGYGEATVKVYPRSGKRLETLGFLRSWTEFEEWYYKIGLDLCAGEKDTLDVNLYGWKENEALGQFRVVLSDGKEGSSYLPVPVLRSEEVFFPPSPDGVRKLRFWFKIPETVAEGYSYRIKVVSEDSSIPAVPPMQPGILLELPTATLSGSVSTQTGGQVGTRIKFTGRAPWFFTVTDESERVIFNNIPTAADSLLSPYIYTPIYTDEYLLQLKADKTTAYKVSRVYNQACGYGKTEGVFKVELILGNERTESVNVSLYPNPVQEILQLDLTQVSSTVRVEVFDLQGRFCMGETFEGSSLQQKQTLDLCKLPSGSYLVKLSSGNLQQTKRIHKL